jgi:hypothetical protein
MNFDDADKTPWFPGTVAPEREGVYERRYYGDDNGIDVSRFAGEIWYCGRLTIGGARTETLDSGYQTNDDADCFEWRGLAQDPSVDLDPMPCGHRDITDNDPGPTHVVAHNAPGLALDSGEFIPADELNKVQANEEEDLF